MRLTIKEKAGIIDTSRIYEGLHLSEGFLRNMADDRKRATLEKEFIERAEKHFGICDKCRDKLEEFKKEPKEQDLPL